MGDGKREGRQQRSETVSRKNAEREQRLAGEFKEDLGERRAIIGEDLQQNLGHARRGAVNLRETGGFTKPESVGLDLEGRGREGFQNFADTGGFAEGERESFLRRATAPITAIYGRARDELNRRKSVQGGYMPGFGASQSRLTRQAGQESAQVSLGANLDLAEQIRQGKKVGLEGLGRTREAAGTERISRDDQAIAAEREVARGKIAGQELLQRYTEFGIAALDQADIRDLQNRLQAGAMSQSDAQLLASLAAQDKSTFDKIMEGARVATGAAAGILSAGATTSTAPTAGVQ